uniref:Protein Nef n=1 Tax=Human immunodeficiency virus 2 TaxID=11709 RepID=E2D726_9HIV2|nr:nef protein [Human immunodeficiency virus 2]
MGASESKKRSKPSQGLQKRLLRARAGTCGEHRNVLEEKYSQSQKESGREQKSPSCKEQRCQQRNFINTPWRHPAAEGEKNSYRQQNINNVNSDNNNLVKVSVTPKTPLKEITYKLAVNMSHFIKDKGGLKGMFYSKKKHKILNIYLKKEKGIIADWQNYTHGPGTKYPKFFRWLWKLVPVNVPQEGEDTETHCLVHPAQITKFNNQHEKTLVWKFNPMLAFNYVAFKLYPEKFTHQSGLPKKKIKGELKAGEIPFS